MGLFPWSFCVCPNAGYPMVHVGHLWSICHSRWLYDLAKSVTAEHSSLLDIRWNLAFDYGAKPHCEAVYIELLNRMGMMADAVHHVGDWLGLTDTRAVRSHPRRFIGFLCWLPDWTSPSECAVQPHLYKILYFNATHVYWHMRGWEHAGSQLRAVERTAAEYLHPLGLPIMFYHPVLKDEAGKKIETSALGPEYEITEDLRHKSPLAILSGLLRSLGHKPVSPAPERSIDKALVAQVAQFYAYEAGWYFHTLTAADLRVPANWKENIK